MITIKQLLESVNLDFEPRFVTKNKDGDVYVWELKPRACSATECWVWDSVIRDCGAASYEHLKLSEFDGKDWTECIYEVPRKTTGKIKKLECYELADKDFNPTGKFEPMCYMTLIETINSLVDAVNELMGNKHPTSNPQAKRSEE